MGRRPLRNDDDEVSVSHMDLAPELTAGKFYKNGLGKDVEPAASRNCRSAPRSSALYFAK